MQFDRVSFATATIGTGAVTADEATVGFRTMADAAIPDETAVEYAIEDGAAWETGTGFVGANATTLTRVLSQSSTGALLVLSGAAKCFLTPIAAEYNKLGGLSGLATVSTYIARNHIEQTIAAVGVLSSSRIIAAIAPHDDTDENHETMLNISVLSAKAGAGQITFTLTFNEPTSGPIKINWSAL